MARVNHKLVKQRLNEKRSKISDRQFFTSRLLAGHFEDILRLSRQSRRPATWWRSTAPASSFSVLPAPP